MNDVELDKWINWIEDNESDLGFGVYDFLTSEDKIEFLNKHRDDIRSIPDAPTWSKPDLKKATQSLLEDYKSFDEIPAAYRNKIADENKVSPNELKDAFETALSKKRIETKLDEEEAGRERRRKELDEMPLYLKSLMTEQAKKRYVDNPESSAFYKEKRAAENDQSPAWFPSSVLDYKKWEKGSLNPFSNKPFALGLKFTKRGSDEDTFTGTLLDRASVGLGAMGAAADAIPGIGGVVLGPTLRGIRSVGEKVLGDDDKSVSDIVQKIGEDYLANFAVNYAPTFALNATKKYAGGISKDIPSLARALWEAENKGTYRRMQKDLNDVGDLANKTLKQKEMYTAGLADETKNLTTKRYKNAQIENTNEQFADEIANSQYFNDIKKYASENNMELPEAAAEYVKKLNDKTLRNAPFSVQKDLKTGKGELHIKTGQIDKIGKELGEGAEKLVKTEAKIKTMSPGGKVVDAIKHGFSVGGEPVVKISRDIIVDSATPKDNGEQEKRLERLGLSRKSKEGDFEKSLNKIINDNERQWEAGFKPNAIPGDPTYEAWLKWNRGK